MPEGFAIKLTNNTVSMAIHNGSEASAKINFRTSGSMTLPEAQTILGDVKRILDQHMER